MEGFLLSRHGSHWSGQGMLKISILPSPVSIRLNSVHLNYRAVGLNSATSAWIYMEYNIYIKIMIFVKVQIELHKRNFRADVLHCS